jgi:hypothetical protein
MANTGFKGLDVRQSGNELVFRAFLQTFSGSLLATGTTNLYLMELQSDGTIKTYDFSDNTFKTTAVTTETLAMTYRKSNNGTTDTGLWTAALATLTGFTVGGIYLVRVNNSTAAPTDQMREFQYGSTEGDLVTTAGATGVAYLQADATRLLGTAISTPATAGVLDVNVKNWSNTVVGAYYGPFKINQPAGFSIRMVQATDHVSAYTSPVALAGSRTIAGGTSAAISGTITQVGSTNEYYFAGTAADFNGTEIHFKFSATGADPVYLTVPTTP